MSDRDDIVCYKAQLALMLLNPIEYGRKSLEYGYTATNFLSMVLVNCSFFCCCSYRKCYQKLIEEILYY